MLRSLSLFLLSLVYLSLAIDVYLYPRTASVSPESASFTLARHLDLDLFEPYDGSSVYHEDNFIFGKGQNIALVIALDSSDAAAVIPDQVELSYTISSPEPLDSLSSVLHTLLARAPHVYTSVYEGSGPLWKMSELDKLYSFIESGTSGFAAIELQGLSKIRSKYGSMSDEYLDAVWLVRSFLRNAINRTDRLRLAILTFDANSQQKRNVIPRQEQSPLPSSRPLPQQPISSLSTCFITQDACEKTTNSCSSRGQCVEATKSGRTCFVCSCSKTRTGEGAQVKTETWVGESCERKDISAPFVLLTGSVVVLVLLVIGSVSLLSGVGYSELPSTLLSTTVSSKRD